MSDFSQSSQFNLNDLFTRALACAAISPGLRSILVFDASPQSLRLAAQTTAQMLEAVTDHQIVSVTLGTIETEDDLWGSLGLCGESEEQPFKWKLGLLAARQSNSELRLVLIPDLTRLSLAAARACVVLMGADVAHLERHGQNGHWQPNFCWLAGCSSHEVGIVSPHLLDRFAVRLSGRVEKGAERAAEILKLIDAQTSPKEMKSELLPVKVSDCLKKALQYCPTITPEAIVRIIDYILTVEVYSHRRELALGRLSLANARMEGVDEMGANHVDAAAQMIWLGLIAKQIDETSNSNSKPGTPESNLPESTDAPLFPGEPEQLSKEPFYESDEPEPQASTSLTINFAPINPYPEDEATIERDGTSLQLPPRRFQTNAARGPITGVEKATNVQDLALVRTLLEAAKFQLIRRQLAVDGRQRLILSPTDLYCYRRAPVAEQMLTLLLDHTCWRNCRWQEELLPYLSWAYVERSSVCLIQIGAADAQHELRAEKMIAKSILVPRIGAAIEVGCGKATPLAHGLDLALQTLRHTLQHGRSTVQRVVLVVISDGRGNVPLSASRLGEITLPVGRKGVDDALQVAERIRSLKGVKAVLLNPQPKQYADLPLALAEAIGATVVSIPSLDALKVE